MSHTCFIQELSSCSLQVCGFVSLAPSNSKIVPTTYNFWNFALCQHWYHKPDNSLCQNTFSKYSSYLLPIQYPFISFSSPPFPLKKLLYIIKMKQIPRCTSSLCDCFAVKITMAVDSVSFSQSQYGVTFPQCNARWRHTDITPHSLHHIESAVCSMQFWKWWSC